MRAVIMTAVAAAAAVASTGCASHFPASPVPPALSDRQAASIATSYLDERNAPPRTLTALEPTEKGMLLHYATPFDPAATPPRQVRLVEVRNDGSAREIWFDHAD